MSFDIIIIGGGIAGLYTAYQLQKQKPLKKILILEKEKKLGGRIATYHLGELTMEMGAGRFSTTNHPYLMYLLDELQLTQKIVDNSDQIMYQSIHNQTPSSFQKTNDLIQMVMNKAKSINKYLLQNETFESFAKTILTKEEIQYIKDSYGYYSEIVMMNAYDSIKLLHNLQEHYSSLRGGLSQLIDRLVTKIGRTVTIKTNYEVKRIKSVGKSEFIVQTPKRQFQCNYCIFALPKHALRPFFSPKLLQSINEGSLCRIYCKFTVVPNKKVWFHDISKTTTNNQLRMIIPINKKQGLIMLSYSDNKYADYWQSLYNSNATHKKGIAQVNKQLRLLARETFGFDIPEPMYTKLCYWKYGVGYWSPGFDSHNIGNEIIEPFPNIFICGENYSENHQQWIEGALETSIQVIESLRIKIPDIL
jgi:protoporphyrinogen oxidase